jgi:hypothetical protein
MPNRDEMLLEMHELTAELGSVVHIGYQSFDPGVRPEALVLSAGIKDLRQKLADALEYFRINHPHYSGLKGVPEEVRLEPKKFASFVSTKGPELFGGLLLITDELEKMASAERPAGAEHLRGLVRLSKMLSPLAVSIWS